MRIIRSWNAAVAAALVLLFTGGVAGAQNRTRDSDAIKSIETQFEAAWNQHDIKALGALLTDDVDFITVGGQWLRDRAEFETYHAELHKAQFKDSVLTIKDTQMRFLKSDVAVVHVRWSMRGDRDANGTPRETREGMFTQVMIKQNGLWRITAAQNTNIR
jgi:uncharacterized protein (TIGR02246 family)